jgi:phosphocarrier protein
MLRRTVTICNKLGLHARAAAKFVQLAASFECEVKVVRGAKEVNGKSIMGVMMLAAGLGSSIDVITAGGDETVAMERLTALIAARFGESE